MRAEGDLLTATRASPLNFSPERKGFRFPSGSQVFLLPKIVDSTPSDMSKPLQKCSRLAQTKIQWKAGGAQPSEKEPQRNRGAGGVALGYRHGMLFWFVLAVYVYTAMPSVSGGDAGELLASGCQLGIPHPPGGHAGTTSLLVFQSRGRGYFCSKQQRECVLISRQHLLRLLLLIDVKLSFLVSLFSYQATGLMCASPLKYNFGR